MCPLMATVTTRQGMNLPLGTRLRSAWPARFAGPASAAATAFRAFVAAGCALSQLGKSKPKHKKKSGGLFFI